MVPIFFRNFKTVKEGPPSKGFLDAYAVGTDVSPEGLVLPGPLRLRLLFCRVILYFPGVAVFP